MNNSNEFYKYAVKQHNISSNILNGYFSRQQPEMSMTPYIMEERPLNISQLDVFSRLMMDRIIFLGEAVDDRVANIIQAQLLFLQSADQKRDIQLYINSPGGSVYAGLGIYDTMQFISPDVATICTGMALSMGAVLLCAGAAGKRVALKHARVMIHQPSSGAQGTIADMEIAIKQVSKIKEELYHIMAHHSGKDFETIHHASDRDHWMTAAEAKDFGMIDEVLGDKK
jgi:ATP-dependent Clp protease, protease subunit